MARFFSTFFLICAAACILIPISTSSTIQASGDHQLRLGWIPTRSSCKGSIAECMDFFSDDDGEFEMDSEINRRILASSGHISYGAMKKNHVPCDKRGNSYYNCKSEGEANPYNRGCSAIARCRG